MRERPKLSLTNRYGPLENSSYGSLGRSPTSPNPLSVECKPKGILKKSNSNIESQSLGYVNEEARTPHHFNFESSVESADCSPLLKPPLHHSLSYTPGYHFDPPSGHYDSSQAASPSPSYPPCRSISYGPESDIQTPFATSALCDPTCAKYGGFDQGGTSPCRPASSPRERDSCMPPQPLSANHPQDSFAPDAKNYVQNIKNLNISSDDYSTLYTSSSSSSGSRTNLRNPRYSLGLASYSQSEDEFDPSTAL